MIYTIEEIQQIVVPIAIKHNIRAMFIFGSYARGTATENSRKNSVSSHFCERILLYFVYLI